MIYKKGEIRLSVPAKAASVTSAVFDALRPIFQRLRGEQKYELLFRTLTDDLRESAAERRTEYVRLGLMKYIEDLLAD